jgi:hypothetical protein
VCVVGLRVYSTLKGDGVKLRVVRPKGYDSDDEDEDVDGDDEREDGDGKVKGKGKHKDGSETKLDPDDISKGAVAVVPGSTGLEVDSEDKHDVNVGVTVSGGNEVGEGTE